MHVHYMQPTHFNVDVPKPNRTKSSNEFRFPLVGVSVCVHFNFFFLRNRMFILFCHVRHSNKCAQRTENYDIESLNK